MWRKESRGGPSVVSPSLVREDASFTVPPADSVVVSASGLGSHPAGSAGRLSRPATVKLLMFPPARAAHRWPKSVVAMSGFCCNGKTLPPAGAMGD